MLHTVNFFFYFFFAVQISTSHVAAFSPSSQKNPEATSITPSFFAVPYDFSYQRSRLKWNGSLEVGYHKTITCCIECSRWRVTGTLRSITVFSFALFPSSPVASLVGSNEPSMPHWIPPFRGVCVPASTQISEAYVAFTVSTRTRFSRCIRLRYRGIPNSVHDAIFKRCFVRIVHRKYANRGHVQWRLNVCRTRERWGK